MSELWAELWKRPGHPTFGRLISDLPFTSHGLHDGINRVGDGNGTLPASFDGFDQIIDTSDPATAQTSLVRVYSAGHADPIFEWLPQSLLPQGSKDDLEVSVGGLGIKALLGYARVEAFDWDGSDNFESRDPDWIYGGLNRLRNPSFEDEPRAISNFGFEDGTRDPWWPGAVEGLSANAIAQQVVVDTGNWALRVEPLIQEGGASTTFRVFPANFYTVTARFQGVTGVEYQIGASGTADIIPVVGDSVKVDHNDGLTPGGWEVQKSFTATGAWETVTLTFGSGANQTSTQLSIREGPTFDGGFFYIDEVSVSGFGVGVAPWEATGVNSPGVPGPVQTFEASDDQASEGTWSALVQAQDGSGILQRVNGVQKGVTYTFEVDVGHADVAGDFAVLITDVNGNVMSGDAFGTVPTNDWLRLVTTFRVPDFVAGSQGTALFQILNMSGGTRTFYVDNATFYQGQPPATVGKILGDLYDDAVTDHAPTRIVWEDEANTPNPYLTLDFSDTLDSNGDAWDDPAISIRLTMRMSYSQVMAEFARLGYEYRIVPDDVEAGTWLWQVYNPGGMSTDHTTGAGPAIQGGAQDVIRQIFRKAPSSTDTMVEGLDRVTARDRDASLYAALGRIEGSVLDRESPDLDAVDLRAAEAVASILTADQSYSYTLVDPTEEPLVAFVVGDQLNIIDPPEIPVVASRLVDLVATVTPQVVTWETQFGSTVIINPDAAVADAVAGLLARFEYPEVRPKVDDDEPTFGGGGGMASLLLVDSFAAPWIRNKADAVIESNDDAATVIAGLIDGRENDIQTIWLHGYFTLQTALTLPTGVQLVGLSADQNAVLEIQDTLTVGIGGLLRDLEIIVNIEELGG